MVSFGVNSLFTNIPLTESIDLAVSYILQNNSSLKLSKQDLTKLFSFATAQTHFLFNGNTYDQIDGVSMGSPLAPVLANLFMGHHEKIWLENFNNSDVLFYRRYVDDTFCLFNSKHDALSFFNFLNKQHPNITFSMEKEANKKLAFLDVLVDNTSSSPTTSVYHKTTYTGLLTNFFSFSFHSYKVGLVKTLVDRTYKINNTWQGFHKEIEHLIITLKKNLFPSRIIDHVIKQYLNNTSLSSTSCVKSNPGSFTESESISTLNFKLPYLYISSFAQRKVRSLLKAYCSNLDIRLVFSSYKLSNMFSNKDPIPKSLRSRVVYKFCCAGCNSVYVGETCRHFSTRVREHISRDKNSHIYKHLLSSSNCRKQLCSEDSFTILDTAISSYQLKIKEALHISWLKPNLNSQLTHTTSTLSL